MFALAQIDLAAPATITTGTGRRGPVTRTIQRLDLCFEFVPAFKIIRAQIAGIPRPLPIYGPEDWPHVLSDTPDHHAARVAEILRPDPAAVFQALCDGRALPAPPPRVPRELPGWRIKAELALRGLLLEVQAAIEALPEPDATVARLAWESASFARQGPLVGTVAAGLGWSAAYLDDIFIYAEKIPA